MKTQIEKQPKSTIKLTVTVPADKVKETYNHVLDEVAANTEIAGFRKGTAPKEMVKEKTDVSKLYGEVVNHLLEAYYPQAVKENLITPIANPKVEIKEFDLEKDFEFIATIATRPEVTIGDFKSKLKKDYEEKLAKAKEENAEKLKNGQSLEEQHIHVSSNELIEAVIQTSQVEIPDLLIEEETERMLSNLLQQAQSIGLSIDQYLKSQNKTVDQLREDYTKLAEKNLKAEFFLSKLVKDAGIVVEDKEVEDMYAAAGEANPKEKLKDSMQTWYIKSILEKNKLISKILEEIEGENHHAH